LKKARRWTPALKVGTKFTAKEIGFYLWHRLSRSCALAKQVVDTSVLDIEFGTSMMNFMRNSIHVKESPKKKEAKKLKGGKKLVPLRQKQVQKRMGKK
jgi:hypothetical protein